jgi:hypothetical protein
VTVAARQTTWRHFLGLNIKGTPAMPGRAVAHDLRIAKRRGDVVALQEFKWPWYWMRLSRILPRGGRAKWRAYPSHDRGLARPNEGAQAVLWKASAWRRVDSRRALLHEGAAKITERRWLRAVLLEDRETGLRAWFGSTHFVVGGDEAADSPRRKAILDGDIARLDAFLADLLGTGHPVLFQLDANIRPSSVAFRTFRDVLRKHEARLHGDRGVEYLFHIDAPGTTVHVLKPWVVPVQELRTDHEGRGLTFRLVASGS